MDQAQPPTREQHIAKLGQELASARVNLDKALGHKHQMIQEGASPSQLWPAVDVWAGTVAATTDKLVRLTGEIGLAGECYNYDQSTRIALLKVNPELHEIGRQVALDWKETL